MFLVTRKLNPIVLMNSKNRKQDNLIIYGEGMMATAMRLLPKIDAAIFAGGVSNSSETSGNAFTREKNVLSDFIKKYNGRKIIYFSSYVASNGLTPYSNHKREMESIVRKNANNFIILRLPQVVGFTKNNTLINFLVNAALGKKEIKIQKEAHRSLIDVADVVGIVDLFFRQKITCEIVSVGPKSPIPILNIVKKIECILNININYVIQDGGDHQCADLTRFFSIINPASPILEDYYQFSILDKYVNIFREINFDQ